MKRILILICMSAMLTSPAHAGLFKNSVDLADLSEVSPGALESLKDSEFEVFVAQVRLNAAKAAKANQDDERTTAANARIAGSQEDLETAQRLLRWKEREQDARQAEVKMAKSGLDLAEAKRDLARLRLLGKEGAASAEKYDLKDFERNVDKRTKEYDGASRKAQQKAAKIEKFKAEWEQMARHLVLEKAE